jgi:hypothetical protein
MKIRSGFISNSSSQSFVLLKYDGLKASQVNKIKNHIFFGKGLRIDGSREEDIWNIDEDELTLKGNTWMNNFDMEKFFIEIGIDMSKVRFSEEQG